MATRVYATEAEYLAFTDTTEAPAKLARLLASASRVVDYLLTARRYDVDDTTELPTDPDDAAAMRDATCVIAAEASELGLLEPGTSFQWESVSIGSVALSNLQGSSDSDTPTVYGLPIPSEAQLILLDVGTRSVWVRS